jgi:hypothetical protein
MENKIREKEFNKLIIKNEEIRKKIDELIGLDYPLYSPLWDLIGDLIDNELEQEELCN